MVLDRTAIVRTRLSREKGKIPRTGNDDLPSPYQATRVRMITSKRTLINQAAEGVKIHSRPSGVAGLTGLLAASFEPTLSEPLGLGENSKVIVFGSEGPAQGERNE